jgi:hypothetical protein
MKINVQLTPDSPITQMDEQDLVKSTGVVDNDIEYTTWVEYRLKSDPDAERAIHRSAHVTLKQATVFSTGVAADFA